MRPKYFLRFSFLIFALNIIFSSQALSQDKLNGIWKGTLTITSYSYPTWGKVLAQGFIEIEFDSLKATYDVIGYGNKEFSFILEEKENVYQSKIIFDLPEFELAGTILKIAKYDNSYIDVSGTTRSTAPFTSASLTIRRVQ